MDVGPSGFSPAANYSVGNLVVLGVPSGSSSLCRIAAWLRVARRSVDAPLAATFGPWPVSGSAWRSRDGPGGCGLIRSDSASAVEGTGRTLIAIPISAGPTFWAGTAIVPIRANGAATALFDHSAAPASWCGASPTTRRGGPSGRLPAKKSGSVCKLRWTPSATRLVFRP